MWAISVRILGSECNNYMKVIFRQNMGRPFQGEEAHQAYYQVRLSKLSLLFCSASHLNSQIIQQFLWSSCGRHSVGSSGDTRVWCPGVTVRSTARLTAPRWYADTNLSLLFMFNVKVLFGNVISSKISRNQRNADNQSSPHFTKGN